MSAELPRGQVEPTSHIFAGVITFLHTVQSHRWPGGDESKQRELAPQQLDALRPAFARHGVAFPDRLRVSCGWVPPAVLQTGEPTPAHEYAAIDLVYGEVETGYAIDANEGDSGADMLFTKHEVAATAPSEELPPPVEFGEKMPFNLENFLARALEDPQLIERRLTETAERIQAEHDLGMHIVSPNETAFLIDLIDTLNS